MSGVREVSGPKPFLDALESLKDELHRSQEALETHAGGGGYADESRFQRVDRKIWNLITAVDVEIRSLRNEIGKGRQS